MPLCPLKVSRDSWFSINSIHSTISSFVGMIPLPTFESRIDSKHYTGANLTFLFREFSPVKNALRLKDVGSLL